jgi:hypothetical protein
VLRGRRSSGVGGVDRQEELKGRSSLREEELKEGGIDWEEKIEASRS